MLPALLWTFTTACAIFTSTWKRTTAHRGIVGMHLFWENLAEIRSLYVSDEFRHKGIGKKLVEACISEAIT